MDAVDHGRDAMEPEILPPAASGTSEAALRELSRFVPGLEALLDALAGSGAFRSRLAEADIRIEKNLRAGRGDAGKGSIRVRYGYHVRPLNEEPDGER